MQFASGVQWSQFRHFRHRRGAAIRNSLEIINFDEPAKDPVAGFQDVPPILNSIDDIFGF